MAGNGAWQGKYDAIFSLDVIEHIPPVDEDKFMKTIIANLKKDGVAIIGTPNISMSPYATEVSRIAHINLYDENRLYQTMKKYFSNVFSFGMNDEIVHTGFSPMACYLFVVCCNPL